MKILKIVLIVLAVLIGGFVVWNALSPKTYDVSRTIVIDKDQKTVFEIVGDYKTWQHWASWYQDDSTVVPVFQEKTSGLGAYYTWTSNNMGNGRMEFIDVVPHTKLSSIVTFEGMGQSTDYWFFETTEEGQTRVTWGMTGEMPFFLRFMTRGLDHSIGKDYARGLENLKNLIESQTPVFDIDEKTLQPTAMFYISFENISWEELTDEFTQVNYKKLKDYLGADTAYVTGNLTFIYHDWDDENGRAALDVALPCASPKPSNADIKKGFTPEGRMIYTKSYGHYDGLKDAHEALDSYMIKRGLEYRGPIMEVYMVGPNYSQDFDQWVTEIYYGVE